MQHMLNFEPVDPKGSRIAIDANPYRVRVVHTTPAGYIVKTLDAKPDQVKRILQFIRTQKSYWPQLAITGSHRDRWPPGLLATITTEFGPVAWVSERLLSQTTRDVRRVLRLMPFFRAAFLSQCCAEGLKEQPCYQELVHHWKQTILTELVLDFGLEDPPEIPF